MPQTPTVHENLAKSIIEALNTQPGWFDAVCAETVRLVAQGAPKAKRDLEELKEREAALGRTCQRLTDAVENGDDVETLVSRLRQREAERRAVQLELEERKGRTKVDVPPPGPADVRQMLDEITKNLLGSFGPESGPLLRRLVEGRIVAVPYRLFDQKKVVLRAHLTINLLGLLPDQWRQLLANRAEPVDLENLAKTQLVPLIVDLFKPSTRIRYARAAYEMVVGGQTIAATAGRLGIPETSANRAYRAGKAMAAQGLEDAYVKLDSKPELPGGWKSHPHRPDVFDAA